MESPRTIFDHLHSSNPLLIAGPCGVESADQFIQTALQLSQSGKVHALRGGLWKPRTRPNSFEGVGKEGIPWMTEARTITGLPIITEVANKEHIELCLKAGFDALWIGARTVANPFSVQEIAEVLRGTGMPVLVKNPIHPDLALWIGAIERLQKAGLHQVIGVHRGFSTGSPSLYRNSPLWELAIGLQTEMPDLPIICDPSHIAGNRTLIQQVAQKAVDLGMKGWMIESHINPDQAWSDAQQQITPDQLINILDHIALRDKINEEVFQHIELTEWRNEIDKLDLELLELLGKRMQISERIGEFKRDHELAIFSLDRWVKLLDSRTAWGEQQGLTLRFLKSYLDAIHTESIRHQEKVMNKN